MSKRTEVLVYLGLGALLGLGVASWRNGLPGEIAVAQPPGGKSGAGNTGTVTPDPTRPPFKGEIGRTIRESKADWPQPIRAAKGAPNVVYIVVDDVGFGHLSCYGGGVKTPNIDKLAKNG